MIRTLRFPLLLLWVWLCGVGCGAETGFTSLQLTVDSELLVPEQIDRVTVEGAGFDRDAAPSADLSLKPLPRTLELRHESGPYGPLRLTVSAFHGETLVVQRAVQTSFVPGYEASLRVLLTLDCARVFCAQGLTCEHGTCVDVPDVEASGERVPDASLGALDAGSSLQDSGAARGDAGGVDAGVRDGAPSGDASAAALDASTSDAANTAKDATIKTEAGPANDSGTPPAPNAGNAPICTITQPTNLTNVVVGVAFSAQGSCVDPETGNLSAGLGWTSQLDGLVGSGASASIKLSSVGLHSLRLCALDPRDAKVVGCSGVQVNAMQVAAPTAQIVSIRQGNRDSDFVQGLPIVIQGAGTGSSVSLRWSDSLQGPLGTGSSVTLINPMLGRHVISLEVTDSLGRKATATRTISVGASGR